MRFVSRLLHKTGSGKLLQDNTILSTEWCIHLKSTDPKNPELYLPLKYNIPVGIRSVSISSVLKGANKDLNERAARLTGESRSKAIGKFYHLESASAWVDTLGGYARVDGTTGKWVPTIPIVNECGPKKLESPKPQYTQPSLGIPEV